jgi:hypothetical protein
MQRELASAKGNFTILSAAAEEAAVAKPGRHSQSNRLTLLRGQRKLGSIKEKRKPGKGFLGFSGGKREAAPPE